MVQTALQPRHQSHVSTIPPNARTALVWWLTMIVVCGFLSSLGYAQVSVLTQNADNERDAVYNNETILTPTSQIHKLFTISLDSPLRGQALVVSGVAGGPQNILLATTSPNHTTGATSAYGFNADTGAQLWHLSLGTSAAFSTSTPVVDPNLGAHGALFVVIKDSATNTNKLHAIDVLAGTELAGSPVTISATAGGHTFDSAQENARPALLEVNGTIYTSFCHMTDSGTYHGWLIGYKYTTGSGFSPNGVWCDTCSGSGNQGGLWGGGDGPVFDGTNMFLETGNGSIGGGNFAMSVVKLNPSNVATVLDSFLPANAQSNSNSDLDLNGGGMVLVPGTGKLFLGPTKYGSLHVVDSTNLSKGALNTFSANSTVGHSPIGWDSGTAQFAYVFPHGSAVQQYCYNASTGNFGGGACHTSSFTAGGTLAISTDPSGGNAILWAFGGSELHAMDPMNVSAPDFWNSNMNSGDAIGAPGGFQFLAIANGKVYAPTGSTIVVYGTTGTSCSAPTVPGGLSASAISSGEIDLTWSASTSSCSGITYNVFRSTTTPFTPSSSNQIASGLTGTTFSDTTVAPSTTYNYLVEGTNAGGTSSPSNQASATTPAEPPPTAEINAGGPAVTPFSADTDFSGGTTINHANTIDLSQVTNPAPMAVYQSARIATTTTNGVTSFTYTIPGFTAGSSHLVRLHFAETFWTAARKRMFNVAINGTLVLTGFDIFATAGAANRANIQQFTTTASSSGSIVITFTSVTDNALISGIEIH